MSEYKKEELTSFINDRDKMQDFLALTKEKFLEFYSYLTEYEYELTLKDYNILYGRELEEDI